MPSVYVVVQGDQLNCIPDGCDLSTAVKMLLAAAAALQEQVKPPPAVERLYLPNGAGPFIKPPVQGLG